MKKNNFKFEKIYIGYIIIIIGIITTLYGIGYMVGNTLKYKDYYIIDSTVINYNVKTEGTPEKITKTSYRYVVRYNVDGKTYDKKLPKYIEDEKHFGEKITITVKKDDPTKINTYKENKTGIIISVIGISISILGFVVYTIINKFFKK